MLERLLETLPHPSAAEPVYTQQVADALAAAATLIAMLVVIYLVVRATYFVLKLFTQFALMATVVIVVIVALIGVLNR